MQIIEEQTFDGGVVFPTEHRFLQREATVFVKNFVSLNIERPIIVCGDGGEGFSRDLGFGGADCSAGLDV